jgi:hypothetical protein
VRGQNNWVIWQLVLASDGGRRAVTQTIRYDLNSWVTPPLPRDLVFVASQI